MGNKPAAFERKNKVFRRGVIPFQKRFPVRELVEGNVEFYRRKMPAVVFKPVAFREVVRIKILPPMLIEKSATAYL